MTGFAARIFIAAGLLLIAFALFFPDDSAGLSVSEARALWVARDYVSLDAAPADALRALRTNLTDVLERVRTDAQPPLYFVFLHGWIIVAGESIIGARLFGVLCALLALALTFGARRISAGKIDSRVIIISIALYLAVTVQGYVYPFLLLLAAGALFALLRWRTAPSVPRAMIYTLTLTAVLYTYHIAAPFVILHGLYLLRKTSRRVIAGWLMSVLAAAILFAPWLVLLQPRDLDLLLTAEAWRATFTALVAVAMPSVALLLARLTDALNVDHTSDPAAVRMAGALGISTALLVVGGLVQPDRVDWGETINALNEKRDFGDLLLIGYAPWHPLAHYDRLPETPIRAGISVDFGWREFDVDEIDAIIAALDTDHPVWLFAVEDVNSEQVAVALSAIHQVSYQTSAGDVTIHRFVPAGLEQGTDD